MLPPCEFTHHEEKSAYHRRKILLTAGRKNFLPRREKSAYRARKKLLTVWWQKHLTTRNSLAGKVQNEFELDPFDRNTLFLFCGRRADRIKGLLWEGDGFLLLYKRLEDGRYKWPRNASEVLTMSPQQYRWLMEGLDIRQRSYVKDVMPKKAL